MQTLSAKTIAEVKLLLPAIREKVQRELNVWPQSDNEAFYSDKQVIEMLPYATRDYLILSLHIDAEKYIDPDKVIQFINTRRVESLPAIIAHALRVISYKS
jgi:hypothetical protein